MKKKMQVIIDEYQIKLVTKHLKMRKIVFKAMFFVVFMVFILQFQYCACGNCVDINILWKRKAFSKKNKTKQSVARKSNNPREVEPWRWWGQ